MEIKKKTRIIVFVIMLLTVLIQKTKSRSKRQVQPALLHYWRQPGITGLFFIIIGKREILLIYLPSLIDVSMEVNFCCLDRSVAKIFLHNPEIF